MNIIITTETYLPFVSGVSTSTDNIARFMARRGHDVTLVAPEPVKDGSVEPLENLKVIRTPSLPDPFFHGKSFSPIPLPIQTIKKIIKKPPVDLVHIQEPGAVGITALFRGKSQKIKIVGALHFTPEQIFRILFLPKSKLFVNSVKVFMKWFYNQCDGIMIPTETFATFLKESGVTKPICVVSNGVDTKDFVPTKDRLAKRDAYKLPKDKILFFFLGRLDFDKHADTIIRALPMTTETVHLVIAGEGKEEGNFRKLAQEVGVSDRITWLGHLTHEQMKDIYGSVDCFVLMSPYEVQSIVTLQAIASGLPVLACREGALPELCHNGENGFTIATDDHKTLAEKMNVIASDKIVREKFGKESRRISLPHDRTTALTKLEEFYKKILAKK